MFAGPNGSGKSTIRTLLRSGLLGVYINPDEIQLALRKTGRLSFSDFSVLTTAEETQTFFSESTLIRQTGLNAVLADMTFSENDLTIPVANVNAYVASVAADFIRRRLIDRRTSFSFETVISAEDKVELLLNAIRSSDRACVFDNSGPQQRWIAEITDGRTLELKNNQVPLWFKRSVLDKVRSTE